MGRRIIHKLKLIPVRIGWYMKFLTAILMFKDKSKVLELTKKAKEAHEMYLKEDRKLGMAKSAAYYKGKDEAYQEIINIIYGR